MRHLSIIFASLLLVGCAQSTDVDITQESDMQSQQETTEPTEVEMEPTEPETEEPSEQPEPAEETESIETESSEAESSETEQAENQEAEPAEPVEEVTEQPQEEVAEEPQEEESSGFTMAMVSENDDASSCWSVINGNVYDLTAWINSHPGGPQRILSLCGADGSASFNSMHQGQSNPESRLQSFLLGPLS